MFIGHLICIFASATAAFAAAAVPASEDAAQDKAAHATILRGTIRSVSPTNFVATFPGDDGNRLVSGSYNPPTQPGWSSLTAILTFNDESQLTGTQAFNGTVGRTNVNLQFSSGVSLTGPLDAPIDPASNIQGSGTWLRGGF